MSNPSDIDEILSLVRLAIERAFEHGRLTGAQEMQARIIDAAASGLPKPSQGAAPASDMASQVTATTGRRRLPNGTVRPLVTKILAKSPGITTGDVVRLAQAEMPGLSNTAVTNELNRRKGKTYANQDGLWSLIHNGGLNGQRYPRQVNGHHNAEGPTDEAGPRK